VREQQKQHKVAFDVYCKPAEGTHQTNSWTVLVYRIAARAYDGIQVHVNLKCQGDIDGSFRRCIRRTCYAHRRSDHTTGVTQQITPLVRATAAHYQLPGKVKCCDRHSATQLHRPVCCTTSYWYHHYTRRTVIPSIATAGSHCRSEEYQKPSASERHIPSSLTQKRVNIPALYRTGL
jgi:hypothetical protein